MGPVVRVVVLGLALASAGCAAPTGDEGGPREVTVLAAASLTDAFRVIGDEFEATHPGTTVRFGFAGSQQLATQLLEGARADVYASADSAQMARVAEAGLLATSPVPFTGNRLAIAVAPGNPRGIGSVADLARDHLTVVVAAEEVPAGRYAARLLDAADVAVAPDSLETDVRAALSKVTLDEADAAIVYASDVVAAGDAVEAVAVPDEIDVTASYPIATLAEATPPGAAAAFVEFVRSDTGQGILADHGFEPTP